MNTYKVRYYDDDYRLIERIDITCELSELLQKVKNYANEKIAPHESTYPQASIHGKWPDGSQLILIVF